jgi:integrase
MKTTKDDDERGWNLHYREAEKQWELSYRVAAGEWRKHRVPRSVIDPEKYAAVYVETKRKQGFPAAMPPKPIAGQPAPAKAVTFGDFADEWTSGRLHKRYPDHVRLKKSGDDDASRVELLRPVLGHVPLASPTWLDDAERAMRQLDELRTAREREAAKAAERDARTLRPLSRATRRQYAQLIHRVLGLAVYPARIIPVNPLPKGFLPKPGGAKPLAYLYPDEDAKLMAHTLTPLVLRVLFGFLAREGMREGEAMALRWRDVDLERGAVKLDANKTEDPRAWALSPGVTAALKGWFARQDAAEESRRAAARAEGETVKEPTDEEREAERGARFVFANEDGQTFRADGLADRFREALFASGVKRSELFEAKAGRMKIRVHDLRATFVTISLATGKTEAWVSSRTGHRSSAMINKYRRAAQKVEELGLGALVPLDQAIPELRPRPKLLALPPHVPAKALPESSTTVVAEVVFDPAPGSLSGPRRGSPWERKLVAELVAAALSRTGSRSQVRGMMVGRAGLEPATYGLKVRSSTD